MTDSIHYEKLDLFYLGRELDPATGKQTPHPLLLKSASLTTHAAIIGMTGSGKTGLGIALLEEAAIDGIPAIVIDPKGDMGNLLLGFPDLAPADFLPWIDPMAAEKEKASVEQLAERQAAVWTKGLRDWDQDGDRIRRMHAAADFAIYTPGSEAGRPVSILDSLEAPDSGVLADNETLANLVNSAVTSLLGLLGIEADPLKSREHVLLSSLILHLWRKGEGCSLETLISGVVQPPFKQIGVFPLDSFYPQAKRMELAMQFNTLMASPAFSGWLHGDPLRIEDFLYNREGKPRISIFSIAHLNDGERMFFVTMLLGRLISWMRRQEGSSGLRCLLYMDEIFGFFPPTANPPSKKPMLLLLKQARAFGLGVVLSTQNPVDLDYKGLANIGTWFVGRLQTRQDQDRVLDGLAGASARFDQQRLRTLLADMRERTFLLSSAQKEDPVLFATRWVLSYLKGPIALDDIRRLASAPAGTASPTPAAPVLSAMPPRQYSPTQPILPADIRQFFLAPPVASESIDYRASLFGTASVRIVNQGRGIDQVTQLCCRLPLAEEYHEADWAAAEECDLAPEALVERPPAGAQYAAIPVELSGRKDLAAEQKALAEHLYRSKKLTLMRVKALGLESLPGESETSFRQRLAGVLAERKAVENGKIEEQILKRQRQLEAQLEKATDRIGKEEGEVRDKGVETAISFGVAILGAFLGRKPLSVSTASRSARGVREAGRLLKEKGDVQRAREEAVRIEEEIALLGRELQEKLAAQAAVFDPAAYPVETLSLAPRKTDIFDVRVSVLWEPEYDFAALTATAR